MQTEWLSFVCRGRVMKKYTNKKNGINVERGISLVEVMLAALVVAIVTGIILRNYISEKQREVYRNLAQVIVAFDKGVFDASAMVQTANVNYRVILNTLNQSVSNNFSIVYSPSQFVCPLTRTRSWITPSNFPSDWDNLNSNVPANFLDPRIQAGKLDGEYSITAWYQFISTNSQTGRNRYALYELEITHADGTGLTSAEADILYALLGNKFCVDGQGHGHYALAGGNFGNTTKACPSSSSANYYTVELQSYNCQ